MTSTRKMWIYLPALIILAAASPVAQPGNGGNGNGGNGNGGNNEGGVKLTGKVESLPATGLVGNWKVGGRTVKVDSNTRIDTGEGPVAVGACVEVRGRDQSDQSIVATKVDTLQASKCGGGSSTGGAPSALKFFGIVEKLPASGMVGDWKVSGRTVKVTATTKIDQERGPIAVGSCVQVEGTSNSDGSVNATVVETKAGSGSCSLAPGQQRGPVDFRGVIQKMPDSGLFGEWTVSGRKVQVSAMTAINPNGRPLKVGDCVEVHGTADSDDVVQASRIQGLGDGVCQNSPTAVSGEVAFTGLVQNLPASGMIGDWKVSDRTVRVSSDTRIDTEKGAIKTGSCVSVKGTLAESVVLARKIASEDASECQSKAGKFEFTGVIETMPPGTSKVGEWKISGRTVTTTAGTKFDTTRGQLVVGACVEVEGDIGSSNSLVATEIEVRSSSGACIFRGGVVDAGSLSRFAVTGGQIVSIFGMNIGPATELPQQMEPNGRVSNRVANTQVRFDGDPGTILYASRGQLNVGVPCSVFGKTSVEVQIEANGVWTNSITLPVVPSSPSIFTLADSGKGRGAILNYDPATGNYSENFPGNPAPRESKVLIFGTGGGQTVPPCSDGAVVGASSLPKLVLPASATIGGLPAKVDYAGGAPGLVWGVLQMVVEVPKDVQPGPNVEVVITVGDRSSQPGVTMAVR